MILWMIINGEIAAYFRQAAVRAHVPALAFTYELREKAGEESGPEMDAAIREAHAPEVAERLIGKGPYDRVYDEPQGWDYSQDAEIVDAGYFLFANEIDWEKGKLRAEGIDGDELPGNFFPNEDLLATEFENANFDAEFSGLSFDLQAIEMLLPTAQLPSSTVTNVDSGGGPRATGRPPKWDWEGVLSYIVSQAQQPDGLPTGPGAQARLEEMMAAWFVQESGDSPAASQIRQRASSILRTLEKPIKPEKS